MAQVAEVRFLGVHVAAFSAPLFPQLLLCTHAVLPPARGTGDFLRFVREAGSSACLTVLLVHHFFSPLPAVDVRAFPAPPAVFAVEKSVTTFTRHYWGALPDMLTLVLLFSPRLV